MYIYVYKFLVRFKPGMLQLHGVHLTPPGHREAPYSVYELLNKKCTSLNARGGPPCSLELPLTEINQCGFPFETMVSNNAPKNAVFQGFSTLAVLEQHSISVVWKVVRCWDISRPKLQEYWYCWHLHCYIRYALICLLNTFLSESVICWDFTKWCGKWCHHLANIEYYMTWHEHAVFITLVCNAFTSVCVHSTVHHIEMQQTAVRVSFQSGI